MQGGSVAAATATFALYPLEVLRVRNQAKMKHSNSKSLDTQLLQLLTEYGSSSLVLRLSHTIVDSFLYYLIFSKLKWVFLRDPNKRLFTLQYYVISQISSMLVVLVTRPLERIIYQLQTSDHTTDSDDISLATILNEAISSTQGLAPSLLLCANPAIHFTIYDRLKDYLAGSRLRTSAPETEREDSISALDAFVIGMISKAIATLVTYPIIRAKVIMMSSTSDIESFVENEAPRLSRSPSPSSPSATETGDADVEEVSSDAEESEEMDEATKQRVACIPWRQVPLTTAAAPTEDRPSTASIHPSSNPRAPREQQSLLGDMQKMIKVLKFIAMIHGVPNLWKGLPLHLIHTALRDALSMVSE
jgi:hypothetical protein